jgi:hypothetical protein
MSSTWTLHEATTQRPFLEHCHRTKEEIAPEELWVKTMQMGLNFVQDVTYAKQRKFRDAEKIC